MHAVDGIEYTFYVGCYDVAYRQDTIVPPYLPGLAIPTYQSILDFYHFCQISVRAWCFQCFFFTEAKPSTSGSVDDTPLCSPTGCRVAEAHTSAVHGRSGRRHACCRNGCTVGSFGPPPTAHLAICRPLCTNRRTGPSITRNRRMGAGASPWSHM